MTKIKTLTASALALASLTLAGCGGTDVTGPADFECGSGTCVGGLGYKGGATTDESLAEGVREYVAEGFATADGGPVLLMVFRVPNKDTGVTDTWELSCPADAADAVDWNKATGKGILDACEVSR